MLSAGELALMIIFKFYFLLPIQISNVRVSEGLISLSLSLPFLRSQSFFQKWAFPAPFSFIFCLVKQILQLLLQQYNVKKCPSRCWDSNSRPTECQSPPITTRPGSRSGGANLWFKSSHRQYYLLSTVLKSFIEKTEKSKKRPGMAQF